MNKILAGKINIKKDIFAGIIVALVSIPISMGYAQIAGLPVVYGLYGSLLPILVFAFMTTSPMFVVGVDAMPAAMVGGLLASMGIAAESKKAMNIVPLLSLMVAVWFILFFFIKAGRIVKYISKPVMGGFISGVAITIIIMQLPKLWGGKAGTGEILVLARHIYKEASHFNAMSIALGLGTVVVILVCKKLIPRIPMLVVMMLIGMCLEIFFKIDRFGVKLLPNVKAGFPSIFIPSMVIDSEYLVPMLLQSLGIAAVVMTQTLLATENYAAKGHYHIKRGRELLAYSGMNIAGGIVGCCPINGSVSRSGIASNLKTSSQLMSVTASIVMAIILLFGTDYLKFLPVPVLTGIVITALIGVVEFSLAKRLFKTSKNELIIFMMSLCAVLIFGTVFGVLFGCVISFAEVAVKAVKPNTSLLGRIPGQGNFYPLDRNSLARPIKHTVIYRFNGNIFFANVDKFIRGIESSIKDDTEQVVVDARGVDSVDVTAVDRLVLFKKTLEEKGIKFYITEHAGELNDQFRTLGGGQLIEEGVMRRTITLALRDAGLKKPYDLEDYEPSEENFEESEESLAEFEWAFGDEAEQRLEQLATETAEQFFGSSRLVASDNEEKDILELFQDEGVKTDWGIIGRYDENEFWDYLEIALEKMVKQGTMSKEDASQLEETIEKRRYMGQTKLKTLNPKALEILFEHQKEIREQLKEELPEEYARVHNLRKEMRKNKEIPEAYNTDLF